MNLLRALTAATALIVTHAFAQSGSTTADPNDPKAAVPPAQYRSAFSSYRPIGEQKVGDWTAANDTVGRIGGLSCDSRA